MPKGVLDPSRTQQCTATSRHSGSRCKKAAIKGGTVCRLHGGAAPQVQRSARERFNDAIDPMINLLFRQLKAAEEGRLSHTEELSLMKFIADRTGFVPGKTVNVDGPAKWEGVMEHIIRLAPEEELLELEATVVDDEDEHAAREFARVEQRDRQAREEAEAAERPSPRWAERARTQTWAPPSDDLPTPARR